MSITRIRDRINEFDKLGFRYKEEDKTRFFWNLLMPRPQESDLGTLYDQIVLHLDQYIRLMEKMSESMNDESLNQVKSIGLTEEFCLFLIKRKDCPPRIKDSILRLYMKLYLASQPRVVGSDDLSFSFDNLNKLNLLGCTLEALYANQFDPIDFGDRRKVDEFLLSLIKGDCIDVPENRSEDFVQSLHSSEDNLLFVESLIEFIWQVIDLGYTDYQTNDKILKVLIEILEVIIIQKKANQWFSRIIEIARKEGIKNWLQIRKLLDKCLDVLVLFMKIRGRLQIMAYLRHFKESFDSLKKFRCSISFLQSIFEIYNLDLKVSDAQSTRRETNTKSVFNIGRRVSKSEKLNQVSMHIKDVSSKNMALVDQIETLRSLKYPFMDLVTRVYYQTSSTKIACDSIILTEIARINRNIQCKSFDLLSRYFRQREMFAEHTERILLFVGRVELNILKDFDSDIKSHGQHVVSVGKLKDKVQQILLDDAAIQNQLQNISNNDNKLRRILEFTNIINKILSKFAGRIFKPRMFQKTQNLLRVLGFHETLIHIFDINYNENRHQMMITKTLQLLEYFVLDNTENISVLIPFLPKLIELIEHRLPCSRLLASIFGFIESSTVKQHILKSIFAKVLSIAEIPDLFDLYSSNRGKQNEEDTISPERIKLCEYFRVLRALMIQKKKPCASIQQLFAEQLIFCFSLGQNLLPIRLEQLSSSDAKEELETPRGRTLLVLLKEFYSLINLTILSNHSSFLVIANLVEEKTLKTSIRHQKLHPLIQFELVGSVYLAPNLHRVLHLFSSFFECQEIRQRKASCEGYRCLRVHK